MATLYELTEDALGQILVEPKNALVKQYNRLLELDGVRLSMTEGALGGIARKALDPKTGVRGLRAIIEEAMLDIMYDVPILENVKGVVINEELISSGGRVRASTFVTGYVSPRWTGRTSAAFERAARELGSARGGSLTAAA